MSITVVRGDLGEPTHLMFEMSVDGEESGRVPHRRRAAIGTGQPHPADGGHRPVRSPLSRTSRDHQIRVGQGLFDVPGITFCGTPGMSLGRILDEADLARAIRDFLDKTTPTGSPLAAVRQIRAHIAGRPGS